MKRWIALLLLVCMAALAACDGADTSSAPVSSTSADGTTSESSTEENSGETSDETSQAPQVPVAENPFATVVSAGKPYKKSENPGEKYEDSYDMELTDGAYAPAASADYNETSYSGYNYRGKFYFTIDLGELHDRLYAFRLGYLSTTNAGIRPPSSVSVSVSTDGKRYEQVGMMTIPEFVEGCRLEATLTTEFYQTAQYVRFTVEKSDGWVFLDELEVIADEEADVDLDALFAQQIKDAYDSLGTINYVGEKEADTSLTELLVSKGCSYALSDTLLTGYSDSDKCLTAGVMLGASGNGKRLGFQGGKVTTITVDLGEVRDDLSRFALMCHANPASKTSLPVAVTYAVSEDNQTFTGIGRVFSVASGQRSFPYTLTLDRCAKGRYVRFTLEATQAERMTVEEAAVFAYADDTNIGAYFKPLNFDTPLGEWSEVSTEVKNLLYKLPQQVFIPSDIVGVTASNLSPANSTVLTDGKHATGNDIHNGQYFKIQGNSSPLEFVYDLGAIGAVQKFTAEFTNRGDWGVQAPFEVTVYLSMDGKDWYKASVMDVTPESDNSITQASCEMDKAVQTRYVRFEMMTCNWAGISELEAFGTTSTAGAAKLEESGLVKRGEDALGFYKPNKEVLDGASDLVLLYHGTQTDNWNVEKLIPYLAYVDTEGNIKDTMFDSFLFLMTGNFPSGSATTMEFVKSDLEWNLDDLFNEGENILALEEAAGQVKKALGLPEDFKYTFAVSLYRPHHDCTNFGDIDGDGKSDNMASMENRLTAMKWYMDEFESRLAQLDLKNIKFDSYYWYSEGVYPEAREPELAKATSDEVHARGYDLFWIPWYCASGFDVWKDFGFDVTCMQPGYVFDEKIPDNRMEHATNFMKRYGMGIEIEIGSSAFQNDVLYNRYLNYLASGVKYGYMKDCFHMYYQEIHVYYNAAKAGDPKSRAIYDYTYQFIKGTLDGMPKALEAVTATGAKNSITEVQLTEDVSLISSFDILGSPAHGTASIADDGKLTFYPEKDFTGTVTITYTYNNGLGNSEPCTVEITVE